MITFSAIIMGAKCPLVVPFEILHSEVPLEVAIFEYFGLKQSFNMAAHDCFYSEVTFQKWIYPVWNAVTVSCQSSLIQTQLTSSRILLTVENGIKLPPQDISVNITVMLFLHSGNFNIIYRQKQIQYIHAFMYLFGQ